MYFNALQMKNLNAKIHKKIAYIYAFYKWDLPLSFKFQSEYIIYCRAKTMKVM